MTWTITPVKSPSSCVNIAILVQLKNFTAESNAGAMIFMLNVFLKNDLYLLLSLSAAELEAYDIYREQEKFDLIFCLLTIIVKLEPIPVFRFLWLPQAICT